MLAFHGPMSVSIVHLILVFHFPRSFSIVPVSVTVTVKDTLDLECERKLSVTGLGKLALREMTNASKNLDFF